MGDNRAMEYMRGRRILEINPDSPVISALRARLDSDPAGVAPTTELLYETALITGGFTVDSPKEFANRCRAIPTLTARHGWIVWNFGMQRALQVQPSW